MCVLETEEGWPMGFFLGYSRHGKGMESAWSETDK